MTCVPLLTRCRMQVGAGVEPQGREERSYDGQEMKDSEAVVAVKTFDEMHLRYVSDRFPFQVTRLTRDRAERSCCAACTRTDSKSRR